MRKWEVLRYTPSQLWAALQGDKDASDPHAGNVVLNSAEDLAEFLRGR